MGGRSRGCDPVDTDRLRVLPVAGRGELSGIRKSRHAPWRAAVLIGVHVLFLAHLTHFLVARRSLSPVEPSESMYTLELGYVNAGFVFFGLALLSTLAFGRFFCGWGCHLVALQDLCGWIMKKLGVRPRPFRSRLLVYGPLVLALYMFVWPTARRLALGEEAAFDGFTNHLVTTDFWATFPGPLFAVLTFLTCGFAVVWFLGAKGFCTYGCPYGAFFGALDRIALGRILVTDACEQCGHCTATCTSNVRVHEEVRAYGMVVDPGCMKCTDCISVCPKNALYFGFARPAMLRTARVTPAAPLRHGLTLPQELGLAAIGVAATLSFRGLYDGPPLLMAVGLGALTAFVALQLGRLARRSNVRLQNLGLKLSGRVRRPGRIFAVLAVGWLLFTAHGGFVQWHRTWGRHHLERTEAGRAEVLAGAAARGSYSDRHDRAATRSFAHFRTAERYGLVRVPEIELGLAWGHLLRGEPEAAEARIRAAVALAPDRPGLLQDLADFLIARGRTEDAARTLRAKIDLGEPSARDHFVLAGLLAAGERYEQAVTEYEVSLSLDPEVGATRYNLGGVLRRLGRYAEAVEQLSEASRLIPDDRDTWVELGLALEGAGANAEAARALRRAVELDPQSPESRFHLRRLIERLERDGSAAPRRDD